jgi:pimeloyl-ACP methyl ester carboxylesterase
MVTTFFIMGIRRLIHGDATTVTDVVAKNHYFKSFDRKTIHVKEKYSVGMDRHDRIVVCFPPCIYSHNFFDCPVSDYSIMDYLADKGFKVYAYDPRGFGSSNHPLDGTSITYEVELKDAEALVNFVLGKTGAKTVSMVAFGSGAQVACGHAIRHPEQVDALALMDFVWKFHPPLSLEFKEILLNQANGYLPLSVVADFFDKQLRFASPEILAWVHSTFTVAPVGPILTAFDPFPLIKPAEKIRARVLIIRGTEAGITSEADSFDFLSKISSQIRAIDVLEGAGPVPSLERKHYQTVLKDIGWFLARFVSNIEE